MKELDIPKRLKKLQPFWGEWVIDDYIGSGSFGEVYRIVRKRGDRRYAALKWIQIPRYIPKDGEPEDTQPDLKCPFCGDVVGWWDADNFCAHCGKKLT